MHSSDVLEQLADDFVARVRRGEPVSVDEYARRHPELADSIQELFPTLLWMERLKPQTAIDLGRPPEERATASPRQLGDYRIIREIGRGGMGIVYEALQESLGRQVALKVLPRQLHRDGQRRARFEREARSAARLHHSNIVPVYSIGFDDGVQYYAMQFIYGLGLDEVLAEVRVQRQRSTASDAKSLASTPASPGSADTEPIERERRELAISLGVSLVRGEPALRGVDETFGLGESLQISPAKPPNNGASNSEGESATSAGREPDEKTQRMHRGNNANSNGSASLASLPGEGHSSSQAGRRDSYARSIARVGVQVGEALHYAHEQGILHRDIKPSNLLLDSRGTVWVTDFGLAKAEDSRDLTATGDVLGTLRYMAPEMFEGRADCRSDVYSLGLTLYELLALRPAFDARDKGKLLQQLTHDTPPRLRALDPSIPRDLETIVHKAMEREAAHRYATAAEVAEDLQRFLRDEPIAARRISSLTRLTLWCKRNPTVAALTVTVAGLLCAATLGFAMFAVKMRHLAIERQVLLERTQDSERATQRERDAAQDAKRLADQAAAGEREARQIAESQRARAEINLVRARRAVNEYLVEVTENELLSVPGMQTLRQELLRSSLAFYQELVAEQADDPSLVKELALAQFRLTQIYSELGQRQEAQRANEAAIQLLERLKSLEDVELLAALAMALHTAKRDDEAIGVCQAALSTHADSEELQSALAELYNDVAIRQKEAGRFDQAADSQRASIELRLKLVEKRPGDHRHLGQLGAAYNNLGTQLSLQRLYSDALPLYEEAVTYHRQAWQAAPHSVLWGRFLAISLRNVAATRDRLGRSSSTAAWEEQVDTWRRLFLRNPAVPSLRSRLYESYRDLALHYRSQNNTVQADLTLRRAAELLDRLPADSVADNLELASVYASLANPPLQTMSEISTSSEERERYADLAAEAIRRAYDKGMRDVTLIRRPEFAFLQSRKDFCAIEQALEAVSNAASAKGAPDSRLAQHVDAERQLRSVVEQDPNNVQHRYKLAKILRSMGVLKASLRKPAEAAAALTESVKIFESLTTGAENAPSFPLDLVQALRALGDLYRSQDELPPMHSQYQRLLAVTDQAARLKSWTSAESQVVAQQVLPEIGDVYAKFALLSEAARHYALANRLYDGRLTSADVDRDHWTWLAGDAATAGIFRRRALERARLEADPFRYLPPLVRPPADQQLAQDSVVPLAETAWTSGPQDLWRVFYLALTQLRAGNPARARELIESIHAKIHQDPLFISARALIAHAADVPGECDQLLDQAEREYERYVAYFLHAKRPDHQFYFDPVFRGIAWTYLREAWAQTRSTPDPVGAWNPLVEARGWHEMGDGARADRELRMALDATPDRPEIFNFVATLSSFAGRQPEEDALFWNSVVERHGERPWAWIQRGRWHAEQGRLHEADRDFAQALERSGGSLNAFLRSGWWTAGPAAPADQFGVPHEIEADSTIAQPLRALGHGTSLSWKTVYSDQDGKVELGSVAQLGVMYSLTYVFAPSEQSVTVELQGNQKGRFWVNGKDAGSWVAADNQLSTPQRISIRLLQGRNTLLIKTAFSTAPPIFVLRIPEERPSR